MEGSNEQPHKASTSLAKEIPSPLISRRKESILLPVAYLESSAERDMPGVLPKSVKSLERRTEGWRVGLTEAVESNQSDSDGSIEAPEASKTPCKGGVWLNVDCSLTDFKDKEWNPTPRDTGSISVTDKG